MSTQRQARFGIRIRPGRAARRSAARDCGPSRTSPRPGASRWPSSSQLLGIASRSTFFKWRRERNPRLPRDTLERLSYLLGIYKSLQILLPDARAADEWVRKPNSAPPFGGRPALERMLSGQVADLYVVRQYLDAERG